MLTMEYIRDTLGNHFVVLAKLTNMEYQKTEFFQKLVAINNQEVLVDKWPKLMEKKVYFTACQDNKPVHLLSTLKSSVVNASIIRKQYHNTPNPFQLRQFIEQLIFDLVPTAGGISPECIDPVFRRHKKDWEAYLDRLNPDLGHAPITKQHRKEHSSDKHHRSECVICGTKTPVRCMVCGAYLCVKEEYENGVLKDLYWVKFHTLADLCEK